MVLNKQEKMNTFAGQKFKKIANLIAEYDANTTTSICEWILLLTFTGYYCGTTLLAPAEDTVREVPVEKP